MLPHSDLIPSLECFCFSFYYPFIIILLFKSRIGLTGTTLTGTGTTNAKITSFSTFSGRSISLSGLYYFAQSDSFEPFVPDNKNTLQRQGVFMVD
jgi:hypothetical protein